MQDRLERVLDELVQLTPGVDDPANLRSDALVVKRPDAHRLRLAQPRPRARGDPHAGLIGIPLTTRNYRSVYG